MAEIDAALWFWAAGQLGLVLDFAGAGWLLWAAIKTTHQAQRLIHPPHTFGGVGEAAQMAHNQMLDQARVHLVGFGLLAVGLLLQLIGGIGYFYR